jgi:hypothetical protein
VIKAKLFVGIITFTLFFFILLPTKSFALSSYDDLVGKVTTSTLVNYIDNYYGKSCGSATDDYAERWLYEFKRDDSFQASYHSAAVASLQAAISSPDGAYAVMYEQKNNHDNTSNPYFITVYWTEHDKSSFETVFSGTAPNRTLAINKKSGASAQLHTAVIASPYIIQGNGSCRPEFLWGYDGYQTSGVSFDENSNRKLYVSTFDATYPLDYEGDAIPSVDSALTWKPSYDNLLEKITAKNLVNKIDNYYGKSCGSFANDYSNSWLGAFKRQDYYYRSYHANAVASLERAMAHGAYAIEYVQNNNGDNTSNPYFIIVYWIEDKTQFKGRFHDESPDRYFSIGRVPGSSAQLHTAAIASPSLIQGVGGCDAAFLWGWTGYEAGGITFTEGADNKLFKSTFDVEYPEAYQGGLAPGDKSDIKYLALGDSYSSGEGDTEKNKSINQKYYTPDTDRSGDASNGIPREKCHVSTRSYPYLLASSMTLGRGESRQWGTVACSGATIYDANQNNKSGYEGQYSGEGNPGLGRLHGLSNKSTLQAAALNEMVPGQKKQIEFIEKYKPKAITLTMGGNDVGFGDKISSCAGGTGTCDWADSKKSTLGSQIKNQFDNLVDLYTELKNAGNSDMKIYVVGYPQFITDAEPASCGGNIGFVNLEEREMIVQATDYMNEVIEAASNKVGVKYIDISDALNGGKLCEEGQKYVTGVTGIGEWNGNELQESYHPNDYGHIKITQKIKSRVNNESLLTYSQYPSSGNGAIVAPSSTNFNNGPASSVNTTMIADNRPTKGSTHIISVLPQTLKPSSLVHVEVHSDPIDLGDFTVEADGSLSDDITIPSTLPVGYHTLYITGQSYSNESMEVTQTILVTGTSITDLDDNGIPDSQQPCGAFLQASNQDVDFDGIDDACDSQITEPILYAARNGDESVGEDPDKLYLFRNVRANSITGITGDYVDTSINADNKEALVALSQDIQTEGIFNKFVMIEDENDPNIKIPTILAKDEAGVCFAMQATDYLSPALNPSDPNYQSRGFTKLTQLPGGESCE